MSWFPKKKLKSSRRSYFLTSVLENLSSEEFLDMVFTRAKRPDNSKTSKQQHLPPLLLPAQGLQIASLQHNYKSYKYFTAKWNNTCKNPKRLKWGALIMKLLRVQPSWTPTRGLFLTTSWVLSLGAHMLALILLLSVKTLAVPANRSHLLSCFCPFEISFQPIFIQGCVSPPPQSPPVSVDSTTTITITSV